MSWHLHPDVIIWIALFEGAYLFALRRIGAPRGLRATGGQIAWFSAGVAVLYLGAGTPIHDVAEQRLFMMHMIQHMLFTLVAPPLMLLGIPGWLLDPVMERARWRGAAQFVTNPLVAFAVFNGVTLVTHFPVVVQASLYHHTFHFFVHTVLVASAALMWWPVVSPVRALHRLNAPMAMVYLFTQSLVPTVLAAFITFAGSVIYPFYETAPRMWGLSPIDDQRDAGLIMKLGGGVILWIAIAVVFFDWVAREARKDRASSEPVRWDEVEEELERMGLTKPGAPRSP